MDALVFNATTAALMVMMFNGGLDLLGRDTLRGRRVPWAAVGLTALALAGVVTQLCWSGAMDALDDDPARTGWWRVVTAVFMQNGGLLGGAWNIATLAAVAALADWYWGAPRTLALFLAGILLPEHLDALLGLGGHHSTDPRNFMRQLGRHLLPRGHPRRRPPAARPALTPRQSPRGEPQGAAARRRGARTRPRTLVRPGQRARPGLLLRLPPRRPRPEPAGPAPRRRARRRPAQAPASAAS